LHRFFNFFGVPGKCAAKDARLPALQARSFAYELWKFGSDAEFAPDFGQRLDTVSLWPGLIGFLLRPLER